MDARRSFDDGEDPLTVMASMELPAGGNPTIGDSSDKVEIEITDTANIGLSPTVRGEFTAQVSVPEKWPGVTQLVFEETAPDSNVYCSRFFEATITLSDHLDPVSVDTIAAQTRKVL